jgi:hypothetical protein
MLKGGFNQNAKQNNRHLTGIRNLDDHIIYKRNRSINFSDTGEEDTVCKRMHEDEEKYIPSVVVTTRRSTMMTRTSWRAVSLTHTFCRCL